MIGLAMKSKCGHEGMWFGQGGELDLIWWGMPLEVNNVYASTFYLVGALPALPWAEDGKWDGAGAGRLWPRLLIYTPLPRLSVLCEAAKLWVCGSPVLVFFPPPQAGGPLMPHIFQLERQWAQICDVQFSWLIEEYTGLIPTHKSRVATKNEANCLNK